MTPIHNQRTNFIALLSLTNCLPIYWASIFGNHSYKMFHTECVKSGWYLLYNARRKYVLLWSNIERYWEAKDSNLMLTFCFKIWGFAWWKSVKSPWFSLNHISHLATVEIRVVRLGSFQNLYLSFAIVEITHGVTANRDDNILFINSSIWICPLIDLNHAMVIFAWFPARKCDFSAAS